MTTRSRYTAAITDKPWWLAGGIPASACVVAYQPIGASDYMSSKINLANPGVYTATDGATPPNWSVNTGWSTVPAASLTVGNYPFVSSKDYSFICRIYCDFTKDTGYVISTPYNYAITFQTRAYLAQTIYRDVQKNNTVSQTTPESVYSITRYGAYKNGVAMSTYAASAHGTTRPITIAWHATSSATLDIKAWALYEIDLSISQINALTNAMNAL